MHISDIPQNIIDDYTLLTLVDDKGFVYIKKSKSCMALNKQA